MFHTYHWWLNRLWILIFELVFFDWTGRWATCYGPRRLLDIEVYYLLQFYLLLRWNLCACRLVAVRSMKGIVWLSVNFYISLVIRTTLTRGNGWLRPFSTHLFHTHLVTIIGFWRRAWRHDSRRIWGHYNSSYTDSSTTTIHIEQIRATKVLKFSWIFSSFLWVLRREFSYRLNLRKPFSVIRFRAKSVIAF